MQKGFLPVFGLAAALGGFAALVCAAAGGIAQAQDRISATLPVAIFFQPTLTDEATRQAADLLKKEDPAVQQVTYLSREQAYSEAGKDPLLERSLMLLQNNPFPATAEVHYSAQAWIERQDPVQALRNIPGVQEIRWSAPRRDALLAFEPWKKIMVGTLWAVTVLLILWAFSGVGAFAGTLSEWKRFAGCFFTGVLGAGLMSVIGFIVLPRLGVAPFMSAAGLPALPLLLGGLTGLGSFRACRV